MAKMRDWYDNIRDKVKRINPTLQCIYTALAIMLAVALVLGFVMETLPGAMNRLFPEQKTVIPFVASVMAYDADGNNVTSRLTLECNDTPPESTITIDWENDMATPIDVYVGDLSFIPMMTLTTYQENQDGTRTLIDEGVRISYLQIDSPTAVIITSKEYEG